MKYKIVRAYVVEAASKREAMDALRLTDYSLTYLEWEAIESDGQNSDPNVDDWGGALARELASAASDCAE